MQTTTEMEILKILLQDLGSQTVTSIAAKLQISRTATWKRLRQMTEANLITLDRIGSGKTGIYVPRPNYTNPVTERMLALALTIQAQAHKRWQDTFAALEGLSDFIILFGSVLRSEKAAKDIDLLAITSGKERLIALDKQALKIQLTLDKQLHLISMTPEELKVEISKGNPAYLSAVAEGIVLFGPDSFIKLLRRR